MSLNDYPTNKKYSFFWKCPKCKKNNMFEWDYIDVPMCGDIIHMECDYCKKSSKMICKLSKVKS